MSKINQNLFRGHVDTIILRAISEEAKYGYEILSIISESSNDIYNIKQSTLYNTLKRLEKNGLISSYLGDESMGGRRRYYSLTDKGLDYLNKEQADWEFSRTLLDRLVSDKEVDISNVQPTYNPSELRPLTKRNREIDEDSFYEELDETDSDKNILSNTKYASLIENQKEGEIDKEKQANLLTINDDKQDILLVSNHSTSTLNISTDIDKSQKTLLKDKTLTLEKKDLNVLIDSSNNEENAQVKKDALKALYLGEYTLEEQYKAIEAKLDTKPFNPEDFYKQQNISTQENIMVKNIDLQNDSPTKEDKRNYKDELDELFSKKQISNIEDKKSLHEESLKFEEISHRAQHFNDLKHSLLLEGYKLKPYNKGNTLNYYYMKYIYSNKISRDASYIVSSLFLLLSLFVAIFYKNIGFNSLAIPLILILTFCIYPIITTVIWNLNPTKRIKAKYNLAFSMIKTSIVILITVSITIITYVISGNIREGFKQFKFYLPLIYSLFLPIYVTIYYYLFKTKKYHLSNKNS